MTENSTVEVGAPAAGRPLPELTPDVRPFWTAGESGSLRLPHCKACDELLHPGLTVCPRCFEAVSDWQSIGSGVVVLGITVAEHQFLPGFTPPYGVALVALDDAPGVRLTVTVTGIDANDIGVGEKMRIVFEHIEDVWMPQAAPLEHPVAAVVADGVTEAPSIPPRPRASTRKYEDQVAITGLGMSTVGRRLGRTPLSLTVDAARAAVADAGLTMADIDGLCTYPGAMMGAGGITEGGVPALEEILRIHPTWHNGALETPGQAGSIVAAMLAVASGLCKHVLCFRTVWESTHTDLLRTGQLPLPTGGRVGGDFQWRIPAGAASPAHWMGLFASQYMAKYGASREALGWIALNARANASRNPLALYRDPLTMEDYLSARMISTPLGLYDCDIPCDGAIAVIVSAKETAADLRQPAVLVEAVGTAVSERQSWDQGTITHAPNVFGPASHMWSRTDLRPADVDVAELYDGFSFTCLSWLEALGFCGVGEAADFVAGGSRISSTGELPLNTHGGQLSGGRTHGYGFVHEAVTQLRGQAGDRQIPGAEIACVAVGAAVPSSAMLLRSS